MSRRVIVAGRRGIRPSNRAGASKPTSRSKRNILTGITIPLMAIIAAFFTTPAYDLWQDFNLSQSSALKIDTHSKKFGDEYIFPRSIPTPEMNAIFNSWQNNGQEPVGFFADAGSVPTDSGKSSHRINLVGNRREKVQIMDIRVHILDHKPTPTEGTLLLTPHDGSGEIEDTKVNLADTDKSLKLADSSQPLFSEKTVNLSEGEPIGITIEAFSPKDWYEWEIEIDVAYGDKRETIKTRSDGTANGPPFQTISDPSGLEGRFSQEYLAANIFEPYQVINCTEVRRGVPSEVHRIKQASRYYSSDDACHI